MGAGTVATAGTHRLRGSPQRQHALRSEVEEQLGGRARGLLGRRAAGAPDLGAVPPSDMAEKEPAVAGLFKKKKGKPKGNSATAALMAQKLADAPPAPPPPARKPEPPEAEGLKASSWGAAARRGAPAACRTTARSRRSCRSSARSRRSARFDPRAGGRGCEPSRALTACSTSCAAPRRRPRRPRRCAGRSPSARRARRRAAASSRAAFLGVSEVLKEVIEALDGDDATSAAGGALRDARRALRPCSPCGAVAAGAAADAAAADASAAEGGGAVSARVEFCRFEARAVEAAAAIVALRGLSTEGELRLDDVFRRPRAHQPRSCDACETRRRRRVRARRRSAGRARAQRRLGRLRHAPARSARARARRARARRRACFEADGAAPRARPRLAVVCFRSRPPALVRDDDDVRWTHYDRPSRSKSGASAKLDRAPATTPRRLPPVPLLLRRGRERAGKCVRVQGDRFGCVARPGGLGGGGRFACGGCLRRFSNGRRDTIHRSARARGQFRALVGQGATVATRKCALPRRASARSALQRTSRARNNSNANAAMATRLRSEADRRASRVMLGRL